MARHSQQRSSIVLTIVTLLILGAVLTFIHRRTQSTPTGDPVQGVLRRVFMVPVLSGFHAAHSWIALNIASLLSGPRLAREVGMLKTEEATLTQENRELAQDADENTRLRALLDFKQKSPQSLLAAEVISLKPSPLRDSAVVSRGFADHVSQHGVVLDPTGNLVGQVVSLDSDTADVLLLTDTLSSAGAQVIPMGHNAGTKAIVGICQGNRGPTLELVDIPTDFAIAPGDRVVTSGVGSVFPKGIPIGQIVKIDFDRNRYLVTASVAPFADFNHLQEAFIVK